MATNARLPRSGVEYTVFIESQNPRSAKYWNEYWGRLASRPLVRLGFFILMIPATIVAYPVLYFKARRRHVTVGEYARNREWMANDSLAVAKWMHRWFGRFKR